MDSRFGVEWTAAEVEEARSIVARLSNGYYDAGAGNNDDTRHDRIVRELQAWFPWRTMRQVIDLYVDLVVETVQAAAQPQEDGGAGAVVHPTFDLVNNFGMPTEAAMNNVDVGMNYGGLSMVFGGAMEETVEQAPQPPVVNGGNDDEEVNQGPGRQHAAPNTGRFWTTDEHRLFLRGLRVYGRGDWKNISKYFVTTRTPVQVSSHAQKYFRRLESAASKQRYSINDVGLYDADPWGAAMDDDNKNFGGWQALAFAGGHLEAVGGVGHIPPATSSVAAMNNVAQFWAPLLYNPQTQQQFMQMQMQAQQAWNDQQMMMAGGAAPMEGAADNFVPAGAAYQQQQQQGAAYVVPAEQWMMNQNNNMF